MEYITLLGGNVQKNMFNVCLFLTKSSSCHSCQSIKTILQNSSLQTFPNNIYILGTTYVCKFKCDMFSGADIHKHDTGFRCNLKSIDNSTQIEATCILNMRRS